MDIEVINAMATANAEQTTTETAPQAAPETPAEAAPEAAKQEKKEEPKEPVQAPKPDREGRKFAALAERERNARATAEAVKREREALKADREAAEAYKKALEDIKKDPLAFMESQAGVDFETLTRRYILKDPAAQEKPAEPDPIAELKAEIAELKAENASAKELKAKQAELEAEKLKEATIEAHVQEKLSYCKAHEDQFELVLANQEEAKNSYTDLYGQAWRLKNDIPEGVAPTPQQLKRAVELTQEETVAILERCESLLTEKAEKQLEAMSRLKRFGSRFSPPAPVFPLHRKQRPLHRNHRLRS